MPRKRTGRRGEVTAKDLAEMGFCEKRVQLAHLHGDHVTPEQQRARRRGQVAHHRYLEDGMAAAGDRRCFVATCVFGPDAAETRVLRAYRDSVLLRRWWGRTVVASYYRVTPGVCRILMRSPLATAALRSLLRIVVAACATSQRARRRA